MEKLNTKDKIFEDQKTTYEKIKKLLEQSSTEVDDEDDNEDFFSDDCEDSENELILQSDKKQMNHYDTK